MRIALSPFSKHHCHVDHACPVPPHPGLISQLYARYRELISQHRLNKSVTFEQFFDYWRSKRRGENLPGLDDGEIEINLAPDAPQLISRPPGKLSGVVRTLVLLVDFG